MTTIRREDFIRSVAAAFHFISLYHPVDCIRSLAAANAREASPAAENAMAQILPVTVAVDPKGSAVHKSGPAGWQARIPGMPVVTA